MKNTRRRHPRQCTRFPLHEPLEERQYLAADLPLAAASAATEQPMGLPSLTLQLAAAEEVSLGSQSIELQNAAASTARFGMTVNGQISRNTQQLVEQIRGMEMPAGSGYVPDYRRAYFYVTQFHQHDFPVTQQLWNHDPSLYINSFGAGLCDDAATALKLIWEEMGYQSRIWLLDGHVVSEVFTGQRWEMYDADLKVTYTNAAGQVAGVAELAANPDLIIYPHAPSSSNPFVYSTRIASIYSTTDNNKLCTVCDDYAQTRELIFEIPAGGSLSWGQTYSEKQLPTVVVDAPSKVGQLKVTIPAGSRGSLNIPLALFDIQGAARDTVVLSGHTLPLDGDTPFAFLNRDSATGNRLHAIEFLNNAEPIEVIFLFNEQFAEILPHNEIVISSWQGSPTDLHARIQSETSTSLHVRPEHVFDGSNQHVNLSKSVAGRELMTAAASFQLDARFQIQPDDATRRPIFDAYRFALEIDASNRPYVYFRQADGGWVGVRGEAITDKGWHDITVQYRQGELSWSIDGRPAKSLRAGPIDDAYPLRGPYVGHSDHLGGLEFLGRIEHVTLQAIPGSTMVAIAPSPSDEATGDEGVRPGRAVREAPMGPQLPLELARLIQTASRDRQNAEAVDVVMNDQGRRSRLV